MEGASPRLFARTSGEWLEILEPPRTSLRHLLFNPRGNLFHAHSNLLERLVGELDPLMSAGDLVSYRLTENLVREEMIRRGLIVRGEEFEFKVSALGEDILLSPRGVA